MKAPSHSPHERVQMRAELAPSSQRPGPFGIVLGAWQAILRAGVPGMRALLTETHSGAPGGRNFTFSSHRQANQNLQIIENLVRPERFELPTYSSGGCRSIQLSYGRARIPVYMRSFTLSIGDRKSASGSRH